MRLSSLVRVTKKALLPTLPPQSAVDKFLISQADGSPFTFGQKTTVEPEVAKGDVGLA